MKLARALWIVTALFTYLPALRPAGQLVALLAKRGLVLTLLLIGANLSPQALRAGCGPWS